MDIKFSGFVNSGGAEIYYETYGGGEPLVMLHGNGEDSWIFKRQTEFFAATNLVVYIHSRGHGKSSLGEKPLTISQMAEDTAAVLDALGLETVHLLGFSDGGNIALQFALRYPKRLRSLIIAGGNLYPAGVKLGTQLPVTLSYAAYLLLSPFYKKARYKKQILGLMVNEPHFSPEQISNIKIPALIIAGEHDIIKDEHTKLIHKSIANSKLAIIPGGNHFAVIKMPSEFNKLVAEFLENVTA